jgi:hypothetical protein
MGLESGTFLDDLVVANPIGASDLRSKGDDHLRLIKTVLKNSFPDVDQAVSTIIFSGVEPPLKRKGTVWGDESNDLLKLRNKGNSAWLTLALSMLVSNSVDINAGTIDGAVINDTPVGPGTPNTGDFTTLSSSGQADFNGPTNLTGTVNAPNLIPTTTVMCFFQAAAPTGWTQVVTQNDRLLRVVSGAGGGIGGSWTISGVSVDGHQLTIAEMPAHDHDYIKNPSAARSGGGVNGGSTNPTVQTSMTGGNGSHAHGLSHDGVWRPAFIDMIIASKN